MGKGYSGQKDPLRGKTGRSSKCFQRWQEGGKKELKEGHTQREGWKGLEAPVTTSPSFHEQETDPHCKGAPGGQVRKSP